MAITADNYAKALFEEAEANEEKTDEVLENFLNMLKRHDRLADLPKIVSYLEKYYNESSKYNAFIDLKYAKKNPSKSIIDKFKSKFKDKEISINAEQNESLIGGSRIVYKGLLIDSSVKRNLSKLKKNLV